VRDSVEIPFIAHAGGNLYIQGNQGIDILALNHPGTPFQSVGDLSLISDGVISGDAHFASGGQFAILNLAGEPGNFISLYDPIISSEGDVVLGDYIGVSLKVEARGSITTGNIRITGEDTTLTEGDDPDIEILRKSPALILRAGVDELKHPPTTLIPVYWDDFEGDIPGVWSNTSTDITPKGNRRFLGQFSEKDATSLTLNNFPSHNLVTVSFELFIINSWDGNSTTFGPDIWELSVEGGQTVINTTFSNQDFPRENQPGYPQTQSHPDEYNPANIINNPARQGAIEDRNSLGYEFLFQEDTEKTPMDSVYYFSPTFSHTANSLELNFSASLTEEDYDESWGIDNVSVSVGSSVTSSGEPSPNNSPNDSILTFSQNPSPGRITTGNLETPGGPIILDASNDITLNGSLKTNGGDITLESGGVIDTTAGELDAFSGTNGGDITLESDGNIKAGNITSSGNAFGGNINVTSKVGVISLDGDTLVRSDTFVLGRGGDVNLSARSILITNGAGIITGTDKVGQGGNLTVNAQESVEIIGTSNDANLSLSMLSTATAGTEAAGDLTIHTKRLIVRDGGVVSASTAGAGDGGNLIVNASEFIELNGTAPDGFPSGFSTDTISSGNAGDLIIERGRLIVRDGAAVSVSTFADGESGNLIIRDSESIELSGTSRAGFPSGLYAQAFGDGDAGNLTINHTQNLSVRDGAKITVAAGNAVDNRIPTGRLDRAKTDEIADIIGAPDISISPQATGNAGNIQITADNIFLENQGLIIAETESTEGGNITLNVNDILLLRHNSSISTTAGTAQAGGNGGNIRINSPFIVGLPWENSDITANAFLGNGGRVDITANKIYGLEFRPRLTPLSDITASSEFGEQGVVELDTLEIDPNTGLLQLPPPASPPDFVNFCQGRSNQTPSHFIISGRGGVPPTISQVTGTDNVWEDLRPLTPNSDNSPAKIEPVTQTRSTPIIEAQGFLKLPDGTIVLTAQAPNVTPNTGWQNPIHCRSAVE